MNEVCEAIPRGQYEILGWSWIDPIGLTVGSLTKISLVFVALLYLQHKKEAFEK